MIASPLSEDGYSMFCLSAAIRVLLPENAMPIFIIGINDESRGYEPALISFEEDNAG